MHAAAWQPDGSYTMRDDARRFENWETYVAGKIALGVAADYALELGLDQIWERDQALAERLRSGLDESPGVTVLDQGATRGAIVTFQVAGRRAARRPHRARGRARQRLGHRGGVGAARPRRTRDRRARARVGALLQHRAGSRPPRRAGGGMTEPIDRSTVWPYDESGEPRELLLLALRPSRPASPRSSALGELEGGDALLYASGMGAVTNVLLTFARAGTRIAIADGAYFGTSKLFGMLAGFGHRATSSTTRPAAAARRRHRLGRGAREPDADAARTGTSLAGPPRPRRLRRDRLDARLPPARSSDGADIVLHSATKFLTGQHDALLGATVAARRARRAPEARCGANAGHHRVARRCRARCCAGSRRSRRACARHTETATELARRLEAHPAVERVRYPGFSGLISFDVARRAGRRDGDAR